MKYFFIILFSFIFANVYSAGDTIVWNKVADIDTYYISRAIFKDYKNIEQLKFVTTDTFYIDNSKLELKELIKKYGAGKFNCFYDVIIFRKKELQIIKQKYGKY